MDNNTLPASDQLYALFQQALEFHELNQLDLAIPLYQQILEHDPSYSKAHNNLGLAFKSQGNLTQALSHLKLAVRYDPQSAQSHNNLGNIYHNLRLHTQATDSFQTAIRLDPKYDAPYINLGNLYRDQRELKKAANAYQKALKNNPQSAAAFNNLGATYHDLEDYQQAVTAFNQAINLDPNPATAHYNLGRTLEAIGQSESALNHFQLALNYQPEYPEALLHTIYHHFRNCDWDSLTPALSSLHQQSLVQLAQNQLPGETPFINLIISHNPQENLLFSQAWSRAVSLSTNPSLSASMPFLDSSLPKIGYLSGNLHHHPVGYQIFQLFDRHHLPLQIFSFCQEDDSFVYKTVCHHPGFNNITSDPYPDSIDTIKSQAVHILVDLMGHTFNNRLSILAARPAPIQISYLGFTGSTGATFIDYVFTDLLITPPSITAYYSEKPLFMPHSYIYPSQLPIPARETIRPVELPNNSLILACFNKTQKIDPQIYEVWLHLVSQIPNSYLWLFPNSETDTQNLRSQAAKHKLVDRLIFSPQLPLKKHLARLKFADIGLDTQIYSGGASTFQSLLVELPVITLAGENYISRMGTSLLTTLGLSELITHSLDDYYHLALYLATHPEKLKIIKRKLNTNRPSYPLFDTDRFTRNLETAYLTVWDNYLAGKSPQPFNITDPLPLIHKS